MSLAQIPSKPPTIQSSRLSVLTKTPRPRLVLSESSYSKPSSPHQSKRFKWRIKLCQLGPKKLNATLRVAPRPRQARAELGTYLFFPQELGDKKRVSNWHTNPHLQITCFQIFLPCDTRALVFFFFCSHLYYEMDECISA